MQRLTKMLACSAALGLVLACSSAPPNLYLIETTEKRSFETGAEPLLIGIGAVSVPSYANDVRIARRGANGLLLLDDDNRWAEPPHESIRRVFSTELARHTAALTVAEPFPRGLALDLRVSMTLESFIQTADNQAKMSGLLAFQSGDGRDTLYIERFSISTPITGSTAADYAEAISRNLETIAATASQTVRDQGLAD